MLVDNNVSVRNSDSDRERVSDKPVANHVARGSMHLNLKVAKIRCVSDNDRECDSVSVSVCVCVSV